MVVVHTKTLHSTSMSDGCWMKHIVLCCDTIPWIYRKEPSGVSHTTQHPLLYFKDYLNSENKDGIV